ncbi:MAG: metallophosphoesterase family protein [Candidatus Krumholzibacteriia bacterium]
MPRHVIIGDVHGMRDALQALLVEVELRPGDIVVFVGDLIDRGPDSVGVVQLVRDLAARQPVLVVKGNHEAKHERYRRARSISPEHAATIRGARELESITRQLGPEDLRFLEATPLWVRIAGRDVVVVHGGIPSRMERLPGDQPEPAGDGDAMRGPEPGPASPLIVGPSRLSTLAGEERAWAEQMLRLRWVRGRAQVNLTVQGSRSLGGDGNQPAVPSVGDQVTLTGTVVRREFRPEGEYLPLGAEGPDDPYWAAIYDGRFGHVYFGHNPFTESAEPVRFPHATGIDLGAVYGGRLAAVVLDSGAAPRYVTVETRSGVRR